MMAGTSSTRSWWRARTAKLTSEVTVNAGNTKILQQETSEKESDENDNQDLILGALHFW